MDIKEIFRTVKVLYSWMGLITLAIIVLSLFFQTAASFLFGSEKKKKEDRAIVFFD